MPLKKGSSKKVIKANIKELMEAKPSAVRKKGIETIAKERGVSPKKAEAIQATAIAYAKAMKGKKKK